MLYIGFLSTCRTPIHVTLQIKDHNFIYFPLLYITANDISTVETAC